MADLMTLREILLARLKSYQEEVRSGRHVPPTSAEAPRLPHSPAPPGAAHEQEPG
jgi:hypothetical protein